MKSVPSRLPDLAIRQERGQKKETIMKALLSIFLAMFVAVLALPDSVHAVNWTYQDIGGNTLVNPTQDEIDDIATMRVSDDGGTQYALEIDHDFSETWGTGYLENIGNPGPGVGKTWIDMGKKVTCKVDGIVNDVYNFNSRYIAPGYTAQGAPNTNDAAHALQFDGTDDHVSIDGIDMRNINTFSVEFQAKRDRIDINEYLVSFGSGSKGRGFQVGFNSSNQLNFSVSGHSSATVSESTYTGWHRWRFDFSKFRYNYRSTWGYGFHLTVYRDGEYVISRQINPRHWTRRPCYTHVKWKYQCRGWTNNYSYYWRDGGFRWWCMGYGYVPHYYTRCYTHHYCDRSGYKADGTLNIGKGLGSDYFKGQLKGLVLKIDGRDAGRWEFTDGNHSSAVADSSTNSHDGVMNNFDTDVCWITDPNFVKRYDFDGIQERQTLPEFTMTGPGKVVYDWDRQYAVSFNTLPDTVDDLPSVKVTDFSGQDDETGTGLYWYKHGTALKLLSKNGECMQLKGYRDNEQNPNENISGDTHLIDSLEKPANLTWVYTPYLFEVTATVGSPVTYISVPPDIRKQIDLTKKPRYISEHVTQADMCHWSGNEGRLFPLRGDETFDLEFDLKDAACPDVKVVVRVNTEWPQSPHYIHVAKTPGVNLDPSPEDGIAFKSLKYATADGAVSGTEFTATQEGKSVLLFSRNYIENTNPKEIALSFKERAGGYADVGEVPLEREQFTIEFWAKRASSDNLHPVIGQGIYEPNKGLIIGFDPENFFTFDFAGNLLKTDAQYTDAEWHHWTCVYEAVPDEREAENFVCENRKDNADCKWSDDRCYTKNFAGKSEQTGDSLEWNPHYYANRVCKLGESDDPDDPTNKPITYKRRIYRDGEMVAEDVSEFAYQGEGPLHIGMTGSGWETALRFHGEIDEVRIWDIARSQAEITANKDVRLSGDEEGLTGYWRFDDMGMSYAANSDSDMSSRLELDGVDDYVGVPDSDSLNLTSALTLEAWVHPDRITNSKIASKAGTDTGYLLGISDSGELYPEIWDDAGTLFSFKGGEISAGKWTHLAITWEKEGNFTGYVNGVQVGIIPASASEIGTNSDPLRIGADPLDISASQFKGKIRDIRIWNTARSKEDILDNMSKTLTGNEEGLAAYYNCKDTDGDLLTDLTPDQNHGQMIAGAQVVLEDIMPHATLVDMDPATSWVTDTPKTSALDPEEVPTRGTASVRVVETLLAISEHTGYDTATVGIELDGTFKDGDNTYVLHEENVPHNGYVFWEMCPYNADIYDRETMKGSIYPVNIHHPAPGAKENILVVWYRMQDNIAWPYLPFDYDLKWPAESRRIVAASRFGSEGKDSAGNDQTHPDRNGELQNYLDPGRFSDVRVYNQPDSANPGYNPNEEHALAAPSFRHSDAAPRPNAAFALRNDLNLTNQDSDDYTSDPFVLMQFYDNVAKKHGMIPYKVELTDESAGYIFRYSMKAGDPVVAPYPLNTVIAATPPSEIFGRNGDPSQVCYWLDHKGQSWAVSGDSYLYSYFWYPLTPSFWYDNGATPGDGTGDVGKSVSWVPVGAVAASDGFPADMLGRDKAVEVIYDTAWPDETPVLKAGETLTFPGGEYRADNPVYPGTPGALGWASGQLVFDTLNPSMDKEKLFKYYLVRVVPALLERTVDLPLDSYPEDLKPAAKRVKVSGTRWFFKELHAGLKTRIFYDPLTGKLGIRGFINDKTLGDDGLTASPPAVYVLQPNVLTNRELQVIQSMEGVNDAFKAAALHLRDLSGNPNDVGNPYGVGIDTYKNILDPMLEAHPKRSKYIEDMFLAWLGVGAANDLTRPIPKVSFGPGLAVVPNDGLLDPNDTIFKNYTRGYVTLAENNHPDLGALPVSLHILKVVKEKYRGAIKTVYSDNVFDEKITLRHTADFGADPNELMFQWWYREEDGTDQPTPDTMPDKWKVFPDPIGDNGLGMSEISLAGAGAALLTDNLFFCRYRHKDSSPDSADSWSNWAGAANSRPPKEGENAADTYQAQLAEGWIKRVLNAVNPFEARIRDFSTSDNPATYVSMIRQAGPRYEGPVAFNPDKDVIENVGLIELYQTVLERGKGLSIDLEQPASTSGVTTALLLAASRISGFYTLLGNEAYTDALDPTVGFGSDSVEYGTLAPTIFSFMNQVPDLLDEELNLLRGREEEGARPAYNRLMWNFTKDRGEAAYALSYNMADVTKDGFINEADGRAFYPQGHGDAWGHYLTSLKSYYDLLRHPEFNWESRAELFSVEGVVMDVDYYDERKFAEAAAAKAKVGREIVNLTYRSEYVEDPDGQWQGYKDTDTDRSWGVTGWARRTFTGSYFDWLTGNAILPSEDADPAHTGLKKIDRSTVTDLLEIASQARQIQEQYDNANTGLNPLGLAADVVPFDIDPSRLNPALASTATHFEQVCERAEDAMGNARAIFDHANDLKNRIRQVANSTEEFTDQVLDQDRDYRNRLIETFGTPYEGTMGPGKPYPAGYKGPDYYFYNYIDVLEFSDSTLPPNSKITTYFDALDKKYVRDESGDELDMKEAFRHFFGTDYGNEQGSNEESYEDRIKKIDFPVSTDGYAFQRPSDWGMRRSPGEIQQALTELVKAEVDLKFALDDYDGILSDIQDALDLLKARSDLHDEELTIGDDWKEDARNFNTAILSLRSAASTTELVVEEARGISDAAAESLPKVVGLSSDPSGPARMAIKIAKSSVSIPMRAAALAANIAADVVEAKKEIAEMEKDTKLQKAAYKYDIQQQLKEIEGILGSESGKRMEIFRRREHMRQVSEKYRAVLAKGLRLMEERKAFNAKVAAKTQGRRYQDMAFRLNLNDALSKYRSAFDLAGRYVYLVTKAYDYETNLSDRDPASAQPLLTDIMRKRTLGEYKNERHVIGRGGLGDILARLGANFDALKGQMGFNNPQTETGRFSLRYEKFRIGREAEHDGDWRGELQKCRVNDLWAIPEFRKFCRPFTKEADGVQPGLVIDFQSNVIFGKNFFGWPLGGGDHAYDPTNFATKVRSVGLWFDGYDNSRLSETPRAYLIPVGMDVMLVPDSTDMDTREWTIVDQKLPVPLPAGDSDMNNPDWIPSLDGLDGSMIEIRRSSSFRAYHDSGYFDANQMSYDSRLIGRSVWNTRWMLIIPGGTFHYDTDLGLDTFIDTVTDIKLFFQTYAMSGGKK